MILKLFLNSTTSLVLSFFEGMRLWLVFILIAGSAHASAMNDDLMRRFEKVDTMLTNEELQELYLSYSKTQNYEASLDSLPPDPLLAVAQRPLSLQALYDAAIFMKRKGKNKRMAHYARQLWMLGEMIHNSFTGNADDPYPLLYREDESLMLYNWEFIDSIVEVKQQPQYDVVECTLPPDWINSYYFRLLHKDKANDRLN